MDDSDDNPTPFDPVPAPAFDDEGFGDDDFGELGGDGDDDFGDFGDPDEAFGSAPPMTAFEAPPAPSPQPVASTSNPAFRLDLSTPTRTALAPLLAPFWESRYPTATDCLSFEPERQVEGIGQVLVSESSCVASLSAYPLPGLTQSN